MSTNPTILAASSAVSTGYPTETDLLTYLTAMGFTLPAGLDLSAAIEAAIEDWEFETGWRPFLSTGIDETRKFNTPLKNYLPFDPGNGLLSLTTLYTGVTYSSAGQLLTIDVDFFLRHKNADKQNYPWTGVEFYRWPFGLPYFLHDWPDNIRVTGKWGRVLTIPSNVFNAILAKAFMILYPQLPYQQIPAGALTGVKQDDVTYQFAPPKMIRSETRYGTADFIWTRAVGRYRMKMIV